VFVADITCTLIGWLILLQADFRPAKTKQKAIRMNYLFTSNVPSLEDLNPKFGLHQSPPSKDSLQNMLLGKLIFFAHVIS